MKNESHMMSLGYNPEWSEGSVKPPIFQTSTFVFKTAEEGKRFFEVAYGKDTLNQHEQIGLIYSRLNNPNMQILEERLAVLEGGAEAAAFESGMSAISTTMLAYLKPGDVLLYSNPTYGGTHHFINHFLEEIGVHSISFGHEENFDNLWGKLTDRDLVSKLKMIYIETPANPTNALVDLTILNQFKKKIKETTKQEIVTVVDNTYLGPIWQKPLLFGADLVCYSATKFLNGHSDVIAGAVMGSNESILPIKTLRTFLGSMIAPYTAWLLTRSLETLHIRMERQGENAKKVVAFLAAHPKVKRVFFPGLKSMGDKQLEIYKNQCLAPGAMIGFVVDNSESSAFKVLNSLKMIKLAVSLGSNESLAQHPYSMTHADVPDNEKKSIGISEGLIRLSVGIESVEDIISDLNQALNNI
jgi:methionine-gamma-lyase